MVWDSIIRAVNGEAAALNRPAANPWGSVTAQVCALLLWKETPHPAATLVVAVRAAKGALGRLVMAAPASSVAPSLAAWRSDSTWAERNVGRAAQDASPPAPRV